MINHRIVSVFLYFSLIYISSFWHRVASVSIRTHADHILSYRRRIPECGDIDWKR